MQPRSSKSDWIFQAFRSGSAKEVSNANCAVDRKHIQAARVRGSTYDLQIGTCRMSQSDQQELLPTRNSAPITHFQLTGEGRSTSSWPPTPTEWCSSLGLLKNAMAMAPPTQTVVPNILARLRGFLISTLSSLHASNDEVQDGPFCFAFPALFSHTLRPNATVDAILSDGMQLTLRRRLVAVAEAELVSLRALIRGVELTDQEDIRIKAWGDDLDFSSRAVYKMTSINGLLNPSAVLVRQSALPTKLKNFMMLAVSNRLNCSPTDRCERCNEVDDCDHLFFRCQWSSELWARIAVDVQDISVRCAWDA